MAEENCRRYRNTDLLKPSSPDGESSLPEIFDRQIILAENLACETGVFHIHGSLLHEARRWKQSNGMKALG